MKSAPHSSDTPLIQYNTVYGPDLKFVYERIGTGTRTATLAKAFSKEPNESFPGSHVETVVEFLQAVDLIEWPEDRVINRINEDLFDVELSFEARLLYHLRHREHPQDHLTGMYDVALGAGNKSVSREQLVTNLNRELEYDFAWNEQKVRMWTRLMTFLGAVSEIDEGIILSPTRALLYELLALHSEVEASQDLNDALEWIAENFFEVFQSRTGTPTVHVAISQVLENMEDDDAIELRGMADASNQVKLKTGSQGVEQVLKTYEILEAPSTAAYQLPMERSETAGGLR